MLKLLLYPLSLIYGLVVALRNRAYDLRILKSTEFDVPIISVGNITVGGTGKTPHVEYLVELLSEQYRVATLSRGYKRKTKGFRYVEADSLARDVGDEPLQIKNKFPEVTVAVCENRVAGVQRLLDDSSDGFDVVILDDAFQHRRITPGLNILLVNYNRPLKDDYLLPLGRLRERPHQMRRANIVLITKCPDEISPITRRIMLKDVGLKPYQKLFFTKLEYRGLKPVFDAPEMSDSFFSEKGYSVLVVCGIASPELLVKQVKKYAREVRLLAFSDHHHFSKKDLQAIVSAFYALSDKKKVVITTEKDAMRFRDIDELDVAVKDAMYYLPIKVGFHGNEEKMFTKKILNYVGENKSNRELHKRKNSGNS